MKIRLIIAIVLGILASPIMIWAQGSFEDPCLIQIYHTNFVRPAEGGVVVRTADGLFFARTYLPGCANSADGYAVETDGIIAGETTTKVFLAPQTGIK